MDQSLEAQLRATLNMIPAYTWYAAPSGALTFVNERGADYLGLPKRSSASASEPTPAQHGTRISPFSIRTITRRRGESGRTV